MRVGERRVIDSTRREGTGAEDSGAAKKPDERGCAAAPNAPAAAVTLGILGLFRSEASSPEDRCQERGGLQSNGFDVMCEGLGS